MGEASDSPNTDLEATGFESLIRPQPAPFQSPMIDRASNPDGFDFYW
jgi:hypothetical protein